MQKGFTLIELVVSMGLFIVVMVIASEAFNRIVVQSSKLSKMEESNIEGVIGLEVMQHDLKQMGFGLPWSWSARNPANTGPLENCGITYKEATNSEGLKLNDAPNGVPRAFVAYAKLGNFSSAYIAVKGTAVGRDKASQRWTYMPFRNYSANPWESRPVAFASNNPNAGNMVIVVNSNLNSEAFDHTLIVGPGSVAATSGTTSDFSVSFNSSGFVQNYSPTDQNQTYMIYGLSDDNTPDPRMPFNRTDFFIGQNLDSNIVPRFCAEKTGILYKATVNHGSSTGGAYNYLPLLDCVADMQVVLGWNSDPLTPAGSAAGTAPSQKESSVSGYSSLSLVAGGDVTTSNVASSDVKSWLTDPKKLREQLKLIKIYILAQEGKVDPSYVSPVGSILVGDTTDGISTAKVYNLSEKQKKYRWKLYRIVIRPKNIFSNSY